MNKDINNMISHDDENEQSDYFDGDNLNLSGLDLADLNANANYEMNNQNNFDNSDNANYQNNIDIPSDFDLKNESDDDGDNEQNNYFDEKKFVSITDNNVNNNDIQLNQDFNNNSDNFSVDNSLDNLDINQFTNEAKKENKLSDLFNKIRKNKKIIAVFGGMLVVVILIIVLSMMFSTHKNTTGSTEYKANEVDMNCQYTDEAKDGSQVTWYMDVIFNYKSESGINYQSKVYNKVVREYKKGLTDKEYEAFTEELNSIECINSDYCKKSHLELGITGDYGLDTIIDRSGNKIIITAYNVYGMNAKATNSDRKELKAIFKKDGFTCK